MVIHQCIHCKKEFDYPWMLKRHYERKYKCIVEPPKTVNCISETDVALKTTSDNIAAQNHTIMNLKAQKTTAKAQKTTESMKENEAKAQKTTENYTNALETTVCVSEAQKNTFSDDTKNECVYCKHSFSRTTHLTRHMKTCKMKDDPIRQLEIKANIEFTPPPPNTCRFCKTSFTQSCSLLRHVKTCKEIEIYKEQLQLKVQQITNNTNYHNTTNNDNRIDNSITNNNNITNNITINAIGSEKIDHIALEKITQMLIKQGKEFVEESVYLISGNVVIEYQKMLRELPENRNLIIPSWRSPRALIKTPGSDEFIKMEIGEALDTSFRNTAKILFEKINEIKELRGGFSNEQTHEMQNLVKFLGSHGIKFAPFGQTHNRNEVKRRYKAANMDIERSNGIDL